jgi:hypothetical protein
MSRTCSPTSANPRQVLRHGARGDPGAAREPPQHGERRLHVVGCRRCGTRLQPRDRLGQALVGNGLQQVVDRRALERVEGVLVVGGDEHDVRARGGAARHVEAGQARHAMSGNAMSGASSRSNASASGPLCAMPATTSSGHTARRAA